MNLPDYEFLSAPLWLITALHVLTLTLHFVAMNFLFGGVIIALYASIKRRWDHPTLLKFVRLFPTAMAATVTLGVAPLLFLQMVYQRQVYSAAIVSGWFWLMIVPVVIVAYYALYHASINAEKSGKVSKAPLILALIGLVYVSICYSSIFSMAETPSLMQRLYAQDQSGLQWNPEVGHYALRWLHMMLGAITVGGFFVGMIGRNEPEAYRIGRLFFAGGMVFASVAGIAYLLSLHEYLAAFMHTPAIWALTIAIVLSLGSVHFFFVKKFPASGLMLFLSMIGMVYSRQIVRNLHLSDTFDPTAWRIATQWSPLVLFLVCFVIALGVIVWLLRLFFCSKPASPKA